MGRKHQLRLEFLGAARTVTGSRNRVTYNDFQFLVDCGLYQGPKELRQRNWQKNKDLEKLQAVILTHAHIDHSGYLPRLVKEGYRGAIYCSEGTYDLCQLMLRDSAHIQEEDAKFLSHRKLSHHQPPLPLYNLHDAEQALRLFKPLTNNRWHEISPGVSIRLLRAGHILGSTFVQVAFDMSNGVEIMTFSGDVGNNSQFVIKGPSIVKETDYLILEGTYGDQVLHPENTFSEIKKIVNQTYEQKGVLVIPSFAVGRTQELLYILRDLEDNKQIPDINIYVDSPMANNATDIFLKHSSELKPYERNNKLVLPLCPKNFKAVRSVEDSMALCHQEGPFIVISASGMLTGGRVLHHLKSRLSQRKNSVLFVGYQAEETKGRLLQSGMPKIRIHKELIEVKARIETIASLSAHADSQELVDWVSQMQRAPKKIFLNHGRYEALRALQYRLRTELAMKSCIPQLEESFDLS